MAAPYVDMLFWQASTPAACHCLSTQGTHMPASNTKSTAAASMSERRGPRQCGTVRRSGGGAMGRVRHCSSETRRQRRQHQTGRRRGRLGIRLQRRQGAAQAFQPAMGLGVLAQVSLHLTTAGGVEGIEQITNQVLVHGFQASFIEGD